MDDTSWLVTAMVLPGAVATPTAGRLGDMVGKHRLLLLCLVVTVVGSAVAGSSSGLAGVVTRS